MKKIILSFSLLLAILLVNSHPVCAENLDTKNQNVSVSLTESTEPGVSLLEITSVSNLDFGSQAIGITDLMFTDDNAPSIVITDIRGDAPGWNVSVSLGEFKDTTNNQTLTGVKLFYPTLKMTTTENAILVNERQPETMETDTSFTNSSTKGVVVKSTKTPTPKTLINATSGKGNGQWSATYRDDKEKINLMIPTGNLAGNYKAELTYILVDGPTK